MEANHTGVPIDETHLREFVKQANMLVKSVSWIAKGDVRPTREEKTGFRLSSDARPTEKSLFNIARALGEDDLLIPSDLNEVIEAVRRGLTIGMYLSAQYAKYSGLEELIGRNARRMLDGDQKTRFADMQTTASAIALFGAAYYIAWRLHSLKDQDNTSGHIAVDSIPEIDLTAPIRSLQCFMYYLCAFQADSGQVKTADHFPVMALAYCQTLLGELGRKAESLKHTQAFTQQSYVLKGTDFGVNGFSVQLGNGTSSEVFARVSWDQIVGNRSAKHDSKRLCGRLLCYDLVRQKNPMVELGGHAPVAMKSGIPGTGKTMILSATATELDDRAKWLGIPFLYLPFPGNPVSTFQGGSADRVLEWCQPQLDPSRIFYAPIDDAEQCFEDRTRQGVSAGVKEIISVMLRHTEGAGALIRERGNGIIEILTNLAEIIDPAILSRVVSRAEIKGAETSNDFVDQDYLWWRKLNEMSHGFVDMDEPREYKFLQDQREVGSLSDLTGTSELVPSEGRFADLVAEITERCDRRKHRFYGDLFVAVRKHWPYFSSRDVRNIQRAISQRLLDFDFPHEWFDDPKFFFGQDYDQKLGMLREQMRANMGRLTFSDIRWQETVRYLNYAVSVAERERNRMIDDAQKRLEVELAARQRVQSPKRGE